MDICIGEEITEAEQPELGQSVRNIKIRGFYGRNTDNRPKQRNKTRQNRLQSIKSKTGIVKHHGK